MNKILIAIAVFSVSLFCSAEPRIIAVKGTGSFEYPAEMLRFRFAVHNTSEHSVEDAKDKVDRISSAIIRALIELGIDEQDVHSPEFNIFVDEDFDEDDCPLAYLPEVSRDIEVVLRDIKLYSRVIDALVKNDVTELKGVSSEVQDYDKYERQAMLAAIADAKQQAEFLVTNLGGKLGKVHTIGDRRSFGTTRLEELIVTGIRASDPGGSLDNFYEFQPAPVEVSASILVEFKIE